MNKQDESACVQSTTTNVSNQNMASASSRRKSSTICTSKNIELPCGDKMEMVSSIGLESAAATAASNIQTSSVEIIEINDSENEAKISPKANLKRKHFFPGNEDYVDSIEKDEITAAQRSLQHLLDYSYSDKSSAYVQHIAEACDSIMTDTRWRTCNKRECPCRRNQGNLGCNCQRAALFSWENGDDLSAVKAFMSLFDEKGPGEEKMSIQNEIDDDQLVFERAMHLYSRMFHRKGPWFDITDLYCRYYAPKKQNQQISESELDENNTCQELMADQSDLLKKDAMQKRRNFFTPKSSGRCAAASFKSKSRKDISRHKAALELLFTDINRLLSMGLVRTFDSEYECGYVAGNIDSSSKRGTFLVAEERREVLRRLGGGKSPRATTSNESRPFGSTNEILAQMQKQQSIFSSYSSSSEFGSSSSQTVILPVKKHVDYVLTRKLAMRLATLTSGEEVMAKPLKSDVDEACQIIENARVAALEFCRGNAPFLLKDQVSALRLREAPLMTLRRLLRVYLIASGGPGRMRGDGTNGWLHVPTSNNCKMPDLWHHVVYPGLSYRLGIGSFEFKECHQKVPVSSEQSDSSTVGQFTTMFPHHSNFALFEMGVEIRSFVDKTVEVYELNRSIRRKQMRFLENKAIPRIGSELCGEVTDQFDILTEQGRKKILLDLGSMMSEHCTLHRLVELDIASLYEQEGDFDDFADDAERILVAITIICHRVLQFRMFRCTQDFIALCQRPWLRHFSFDSILAYVIWDCIPVLERNGKYQLAISVLLTILLGSTHTETEVRAQKINELVDLDVPYIQFLLPRRNRGKAFERLIIDLTHVYRALKKRKKTDKKSEIILSDEPSPIISLIKCIVCNTSVAGSIPFCFIRSLAKRLKVPLYKTMEDLPNKEIELLGIRLVNTGKIGEATPSECSDWSPTVDYSVANALSNGDKSAVGQRCSFISWDAGSDQEDVINVTRNLTVEELALDMYHQGVLPADDSMNNGDIKGGFVGWHCEGSHVRAIFRILCLQDLLGQLSHRQITDMDNSIFLTPYQASPYDLHVGMQSARFYGEDRGDPYFIPGRSFYERRREVIDEFLEKLAQLDSQSICDLLHVCLEKRYLRHSSVQGILLDESLQRDMAELRSISCVAAGLGGKVLAAIFRCLCLDYRHYSGGLPDILLIRARYVNSDGPSSLVDLGDWIGEEFSKDNIEKGNIRQTSTVLKDDEFLGCSKNGDGLKINNFRSNKKTLPIEPVSSLPPKLVLMHDGKNVAVDTVLVEVKSANDRLDARQEDWLNILDAKARLCQFGDKKIQKKRAVK